MTGYVTTGTGEVLQLAPAKAWSFTYGLGVPCDSFSVVTPWTGVLPVDLEAWSTFEALYQGAVVFTGVIDEVEVGFDASGATLEVVGRGMAARLLDNDVLGVEYMTATLDDMIGTYVTPFGVEIGERDFVGSRASYVVETGSSAWTVLDDFVSYYTDIVPRFNKVGDLLLTALPQESKWQLVDRVPVVAMSCGWKRYGACSEVWVRDRVSREVNVVTDEGQKALGLCRRAVVTTASQSSNQNRVYDGQYRLTASQKEMRQLTVTLPFLQWLEAGILVEVQRKDCPWEGEYRLLELEVCGGAKGVETTLVLGDMK